VRAASSGCSSRNAQRVWRRAVRYMAKHSCLTTCGSIQRFSDEDLPGARPRRRSAPRPRSQCALNTALRADMVASAFVALSGTWAGLPVPASSLVRTERKSPVSTTTRRRPRASLDLVAPAVAPALLVAENLYGQIALGGIGIIGSGLVGAFCVALIARSNYDAVRAAVLSWLSKGGPRSVACADSGFWRAVLSGGVPLACAGDL
jgi:hypothetical protein